MTLLPQVRSQLDSAAHRQAARDGRRHGTLGVARRPRRRRLTLGAVATVAAVVLAVGVGVGAIALLSHHDRPATSQPPQPSVTATSTSSTTDLRSIARYAASQFAVFARPQTAKDRSLVAAAREAVRRGGLGGGLKGQLDGLIPSLTRYTQTLPDGREAFLAVYDPASVLPPRARAHLPLPDIFIAGPVIVQPDGTWTDGQPLDAPKGGTSSRAAYITARTGGQACSLDTYTAIVPNRVARIRWQFGRQDRLGYVFKGPLTVNFIIHDNLGVATIPERASCDRPAAVTLYGDSGQVLSQTGSTRNLDRITRPVNHGNPFGYQQLLHRP